MFLNCRKAPPTSETLKPVTPGYPAPRSWLLDTTSLASVVGAGRELLYLVQHKQQIPIVRICARARKDQVAEDVLEVALLGGPEYNLPFLHGKQLVELTHSHQLHPILILMRPPCSLHPMLIKARRRLTPYYGLRWNRIPRYRSETCGFRDCTCVMALNKSPTLPTRPPKAPVTPMLQPFIHSDKLLVSRLVIGAEKTYIGLEKERIFPVDVILEELSKSKVAEEPCPCFKDWTSDLRGLEFT